MNLKRLQLRALRGECEEPEEGEVYHLLISLRGLPIGYYEILCFDDVNYLLLLNSLSDGKTYGMSMECYYALRREGQLVRSNLHEQRPSTLGLGPTVETSEHPVQQPAWP